jgi:hypothetical protein
MGGKDIARYETDPSIRGFVLQTASCSWRDSMPNYKGCENPIDVSVSM